MNTEWKPIASAPENEGRPLFCELCWGPEGDQATGSGFRLNGKWYAAGVFYCLGQEKRYELREVEVQPTHWKPRSDLPDEESAAPTSHPIPTGATGEAGEALRWRDGEPPFPQNQEWFIAETTYGDRVVLCALPKGMNHDYKTADETYLRANLVKRWMQFPDCEYIPPEAPAAGDALGDPALQKLFGEAITGALGFGAQGVHPPPVGHWLEPFWNMARADAALAARLALLDHPLLRDVLGYVEDAGPADVWGAAQSWMSLRDAAIAQQSQRKEA